MNCPKCNKELIWIGGTVGGEQLYVCPQCGQVYAPAFFQKTPH